MMPVVLQGITNDLEVKYCVLKVKKMEVYSIPEGKIYPGGTAKTPDLKYFTMAIVNPYRISVGSKRRGYVYWGDVGRLMPEQMFQRPETRGILLIEMNPVGRLKFWFGHCSWRITSHTQL